MTTIVQYSLKIIVINFFLLIFNMAYSFDYEIEYHAKRKTIKSIPISKDEKFISFTLDGTFSDNLGNYGFLEQASTLILKDNNVLKLDGYGKTIYQNRQATFHRGYRSQQEQDAGVGESVVLEATDNFKILKGMRCKYAVKFFEDTAYVLSKCKITKKQKNLLSNLD